MISKCSRGIWEVCIVMEHKEEWCPKAQTHYKLLCKPNYAGNIIQLFANPPHLPNKQTNKQHQMHVHTPRASSKVGFINKWKPGDEEVYIVHVAQIRCHFPSLDASILMSEKIYLHVENSCSPTWWLTRKLAWLSEGT